MIYELRNYTMRPGRRDELIALFEREFVEPQEAVGIRVTGTFRDPDAPDTFPWVRAFPDMESRRASLEAFYGGPVWRAHRDAANATMESSDDVLLLRPAGPEFQVSERPPVGAAEAPPSSYVATVYHVTDGFAGLFARAAAPVLAEAGVPPVACFETEPAQNTFPRLPVRTGVKVFVWFARFDTPEAEREVDLPMLEPCLTAAPVRLRLRPTARSSLR
ncbi:NIPSNAP family protein [Nonomuraea terrae]|uniref:NIPSNAP family protein n=1 Tax=Nonomuraea terrae TaxID=2530383 RepID=A0A4R4YQA8_9ACTN|nr:NIPSNAP family protein [Nonomuraea terrae]TDD47303.1 NIPSNAP family protein [Nonomuraea terrae]